MTQRDASTTHLMLRTGLWLCAVPVSVVEETMRPLPITPLECGIGPVKGLAICRGEAVPVVCAAELLGEKAAEDFGSRGGERLAFAGPGSDQRCD
jgi:chemotaxis signal transduction protein